MKRLLLAPLLVLLIMTPVTLTTTGCPGITNSEATEVQQDGAALAQALNSIAALESQQGDTDLASKLTSAANALAVATSNFQPGGVTTIISDAANVAETVLAAIPLTAAYAPLVPIAVAAIDALLNSIGAHTATANAVTPASVRLAYLRGAAPKIKPNRKAFLKAWNAKASEYHLSQLELGPTGGDPPPAK